MVFLEKVGYWVKIIPQNKARRNILYDQVRSRLGASDCGKVEEGTFWCWEVLLHPHLEHFPCLESVLEMDTECET